LVALREMRRVLDHGGRLALSVWTGIGPYHVAVGDVLTRFVGNAAATKFCSSRQVPTRDELYRLATDAGFSDVEVHVSRLDIHLPRLDQFVLDHLKGTPVAPMIAAASPEVRKKIGASAMEQLRRYADGDGATYPEETHVLTGRVQ
jgi:SAM-dependent methyltransferase